MEPTSRWAAIGLGFVLPIALIVLILAADLIESPKTAYVGVLAVVPMLSAVFATPRLTALVAVITWLSAFTFGHLASDGNVAAQTVRLIIIALAGLAAIGAAELRRRRERRLLEALRGAEMAEQMRRLAETDALTGLSNRHGLTARVANAESGLVRTVSLIDCDDLKKVNDTLGHQAGDEYLQAIAGRLAGSLAKADMIARWGGDEFIVVQRLSAANARATLTRMHAAINASPIRVADSTVEGSVCIGIAEWAPGMSFDDALAAADRALYRAKQQGRNLIVSSDD